MEFRKYQHVERLGTSEVQDILFGECYVFPKIDGTNASVWNDNGVIKAGSRKRELSLEADNAGFFYEIVKDGRIVEFLTNHPNIRLYGEWLVPHSLKTYRQDAWRKFYVFDAVRDGEELHMHYLAYKPLLDSYGIEYIPPIAIIKNPTVESIYNCLDKTQYLVEDGKGLGEGVVVKNYDYVNKYGRQTWAKVVRSEFKEKHAKTMGAPQVIVKEMIEVKIVDDFCTEAFIEKEHAKIVNDENGWSSKMIPRLLNTVYNELIKEESFNIVRKYKNPTINYKTLYGLVMRKVKEVKSDIF